MKLYLDFEPCDECKSLMKEICTIEVLFDDDKRADESAKFLRHLTYNHKEVVKGVISELPKQKSKQEFDFFK